MLNSIRQSLRDLARADRGFLFGLLGYPVRVHPFFWITAVFLAFHGVHSILDGLRGVAVVFVSVLVHELGHALVASRWGVVHGITLHGLGGVTRWRAVLTSPGWHARITISLAGPVAGFVLAAVCAAPLRWAGASLPWWAYVLLFQLVWTNVAWGIFNLLPIPPLDGGQITYEVLSRTAGPRAELWSPLIACVTIAVTTVLALWWSDGWLLGLLVWFAITNGLKLKAWMDAHRRTQWSVLDRRR